MQFLFNSYCQRLYFCFVLGSFFCFAPPRVSAQDSVADSLKKILPYQTGADSILSFRTLVNYLYLNNSPDAPVYLEKLKQFASAHHNDEAYSFYYKLSAKNQKDRKLNNDSALYFIDQAIYYAKKCNSDRELASNYLTLAMIYAAREQLDSSILAYQKVLTIPLTGDDLRIHATAYTNLGLRMHEAQNFRGALLFADSAAKVLTKAKYPAGLVGPYRQFAMTYLKMAEYDSAIFYSQKLIDVAQEERDYPHLSDGYMLLSRIQKQMGNFALSEKYIKQSFNICTEKGLNSSLAIVVKDMIILFRKTQQADSMEHYFNLLQTKFSQQLYKSSALLNEVGKYYYNQGDYLQAKEYLLAVYEKQKKNGRDAEKITCYRTLGQCYAGLNKTDSALFYLNQMLALAQKGGELMELRESYLVMSQFYEKQKNYDLAIENLKLFASYNDSVLTAEKIKSVTEAETKYETEKKLKQIKQLEAERKLTDAELKLKRELLQKEYLLNKQRTQQLEIADRDNEIKSLEIEQKSLAIENQKNTNVKTEQQLLLSKKESELKDAQLKTESLNKKYAVAGIMGLIGIGGYIFFLYDKRKKLSHQLSSSLSQLRQTQDQLVQIEKEKESEAIRLRISRDIHDDIGSNLTKIAMMGNLAAAQSKNKLPEMTEQLERISDYARNVNNSMSEIVWAINPRQDTLENLLGYMRVHTQEFLKDSGIDFQFNFPTQIPAIQLNPDLKRGLFLVLKEVLNNTVKHSDASAISISWDWKDHDSFSKNPSHHAFIFSISDNGKGFITPDKKKPMQPLKGGNGFLNLEARMVQVGCHFKVQSSPGHGCMVTVTGNI